MNWRDPTSDIINALKETMFRTSLASFNTSKYATVIGRPDLPNFTDFYEAYPVNLSTVTDNITSTEPQVIQMRRLPRSQSSKSNYAYLGAALGVMVLGFLVATPAFYGFWELEREISLNPLEIAKAFNAQMLRGKSSNAAISRFDKEGLGRKVQYGEVIDDQGDMPTEYRGAVEGPRFRGRRLEIADPNRINRPAFNEMYMLDQSSKGDKWFNIIYAIKYESKRVASSKTNDGVN